jgi:hypothetical protein
MTQEGTMRIDKLMTRAALLASTVALLVGVSASAAAQAAKAARKAPPATHNDCMFTRSLRDWRPLDDEHLLLFGPGHTAYLVELVRPAMGLSFNISIGVYDRDGNICPYGGDSIVIEGPIRERISIRSMQRLDDAELDEVYVRFGIRPPAVVKTEPVDEANSSK